jgi:hypothetical protein
MTAVPQHLQTWAFKPQERAVAKAAGDTTYFTGRPCKGGHVAYRCTANGQCVECSKKSQKESRRRKLEKNPNYEKEKYAKNPEKYRAVAAKYRAENLEKARESSRKSMRLRKPQRASWQMLRMARKLQATPKWLSEHELSWIKAHYVAAKENGANLAVDHIVPLRGREVCGLHVPWNLCLRTKSDNSKKHNKLTDEAYLPKQFGILVSESALPWNLRKESNYGNHMESR